MENLARSWYREVSRTVAAPTHRQVAELESLAQDLLLNVDATGVAIAVEDVNDPESLVCMVSAGGCLPPVDARLDPNSGISGRCVRECRSQKSYDTLLDPRVERAACERLGIRSLAVVPVVAHSHCIGLIEAVSDSPGHFDADKVLAIEQAAKSAALLLEGRESASEQPILVMSPPSRQSEEQAIPHGSERDIEPPPEAAFSTQDEDTRPPTPLKIPKFLETQQSEPGRRPWLRWVVIVVIALVAAISGIRLLRGEFPGHLFAASRNTANPVVPSSPPAGESVSSPEGSTSISPPPPVIKTDRDSSFQTLAQRADRGDVAAQMDLAQAYLTGDNVPVDQAKAASWYIMAGENGSAEGKRRSIEITHGMAPFQIGEIRFNLGKMYMSGTGAAQDYVSAYAWFELAKAAGDIRAQAEENTLEQKMDSGRVQEGRQRASQWLKSHSRKAPKTRPQG
jgi:hypothetical protein